jgi:hypothetical protein
MTAHPDPKFAEAVAWLRAQNIPFRHVTRYQLKIGTKVSFYPGKQTVFVDREECARAQTGLAAALIEFGYVNEPRYKSQGRTLTSGSSGANDHV